MKKIMEITAERDAFVRDILRANVSSRAISSLKKYGKMTINGVAVRADTRISRGDTLRLEFPEEREEIATPYKLDIEPVYEDGDYLVIDKAMGIPCIVTGKKPCLLNGLKYLYPDEKFHIITRLDKDTAGLVLLAKNAPATFALKDIQKTYLALAEGKIEGKTTLNLPIADDNGFKRYVSDSGKPSVTEVEPINFDGKNTLVECRLLTGRTHQIRVHLSYIGHPIVGDTLYGNGVGEFNGGQNLICKKLSFTQPYTGEKITLESEREL